MSLRELIAWVTAGSLLVVLVLHVVRQRAEDREIGEMLYDCAAALDERDAVLDECHKEIADVYYDFGDRIIKCNEELCRTNGWTPPPDWEEMMP